MPISLTVTRGFTFTGSTALSSANLNAAAQPAVELAENASITPGYLDIPALINEVGSSLQGANFLQNGGFGGSQWANTSPGLTVDADELTENAWGWFLRATGGTPIYRRVAAGPANLKSRYAAEIVGASGVTMVEFGAWIPAATTQKMLDENVVFSCYIYNPNASISVIPTLYTAQSEDVIGTVVSVLTGTPVTCPNAVWTRIEITFDTGLYADWTNGAWLGFTTVALDANTKSLQVAQGQLESGSTATDYKRNPPTEDRRVVVPVTEFQGEETLGGGRILLVLPDGLSQRYLSVPPPGLVTPVLGWNKTSGIPEWQDAAVKLFVCKFNGARQRVTVPASAVTRMKVHCWGAGGCDDGNSKGGHGGYSYAEFTVSATIGHINYGDVLSVIVGQGGKNSTGPIFGFGGAATGASQPSGGGLSGVFTGDTEVAATDTSRALVIAGGGGAGGQNSTAAVTAYGGHGNDPSRSGGTVGTMQGLTASGGTGVSGGGGGYAGGNGVSLAGKGGSGYVNTVHAAYVAATLEMIPSISVPAVYPTNVVPGSHKTHYTGTIGARGVGSPGTPLASPGMVVIEFT